MAVTIYERKKPIPREKIMRVERLKELFRKYDKVVIFDFRELPANLMKDLRKKLYGKGEVIVIKNTLAKKALDEIIKEKPYFKRLENFLEGMRALVFTQGDVFEIARLVDSIREKRPAKPGKIAPFDIVIPKGNTGLKPGPAMTDLRLANIPTRIIEGELWIMKDTVLVRKGQRISSQAAKVLQLLDIIPFEVKPKIIAAIDEENVIPSDILLIPLEEYEKMINEAYISALNTAVHTSIPIPEAIELIVSKAISDALKVAVDTALPTIETAELLISRAIND